MLFFKAFAVALIATLVGFIKFIYFISLGYGLSIASIGVYFLFTQKKLDMREISLGILYFLYGFRLGVFLLIRDLKNHSYNEKMSEERNSSKEVNCFMKILVWISCASLYSCQTSPLIFRFNSKKKDNYIFYVGIVIAFIGFLIEARADHEKNQAKRITPNRFVDTGLYRIVRCPNYFGEILFWTGNFISGIKIYSNYVHWGVSGFGYLCIILVMYSGTKKLESRQNISYGNDLDYQNYVQKTPILFPFIPIYTFQKNP